MGSVEVEYIIPPGFSDIANPITIVEIPFCTKNEVFSQKFMRKFHNFTGSKFDFQIKWITRKTKTLLNGRISVYILLIKYTTVFAVAENYVEETVRNLKTKWNEHNMPSEISNLSRHLNNNITHHFI